MGRWKNIDDTVEHRQTLFVQSKVQTSGAILIKKNSGTEVDNRKSIVTVEIVDIKNRVVDMTGHEDLIDEIKKHPEKFGNDPNHTGLRVKPNKADESASYVSHFAAEKNFRVLPKKYRVYTNNGNRNDFSELNQRIVEV
jgi:hypothetical protein